MTATVFDTLAFAEELKKAGIDNNHASAHSRAMQHALDDALNTQLATKDDIQRIETTISELNSRMTLMQWMLGIIIAAQILPLIRALGIL